MIITFKNGHILFKETALFEASRLFVGASRDYWNVVIRDCTRESIGEGYYDVLIYARKRVISWIDEVELLKSFDFSRDDIIVQNLYPNTPQEGALLAVAEQKRKEKAYQPKPIK